MEVVAADDTWKVFDIGLDVVHVDAERHCLEKDATSSLAERDGGGEDDGCDYERDGGVEVEATGEFGEPDYERGGDYTNVAERIAHDVKEDAFHVQVAVRVTVTFTGFFRLAVDVLMMAD